LEDGSDPRIRHVCGETLPKRRNDFSVTFGEKLSPSWEKKLEFQQKIRLDQIYRGKKKKKGKQQWRIFQSLTIKVIRTYGK
jgi:hypothetical protein